MEKDKDIKKDKGQQIHLSHDDKGYVTKGEFKKGLEDFGRVLKAEIVAVFTEKVAQVEEKFFKYTFIAVGIVLGGVGLLLTLFGTLQYNFSKIAPQPIVIYTNPQPTQNPTSNVISSQISVQEDPQQNERDPSLSISNQKASSHQNSKPSASQ